MIDVYKNYKTALFKSSFPRGEEPKAILVLVPGSNHDGRDLVHSKAFKKFSKENECALIGCFFEDIDPTAIEGYADASGGSGQALLDFIEKEGWGHLPIFLWGFSAGGQFNYEMTCWAPERIAGFVVNKGGFYYTALAPPATRATPGLFFIGNHDDLFRQYIVAGIYMMNKRDHNCIWQLVEEPVGHDPGDSVELSLEFFKEILEKALN